ncbi:hypothetical protein DFH29DRAFT_1071219 [Suillus ampliporus]|nr:hypothetical protein DFH29DRAFT_1071219 [Suillus ampliporus]
MAKNTAKKHAAGGTATRVSGPLGLPAASPVPASPGIGVELEVARLEVHSQWCLICHDGAEGDIVLYECSGCPRVMCSRCLEVPPDSRNIVSRPDVLFWCLSCHTEHNKKVPAPYHGFYSGTLPSEGGKPALRDALRLNGIFETVSCAVLAAAPIAAIHFILGGSKEIVTPVPFLSHYLSHYFPNGGYLYLEVPFDIATHRTIRSYTCTQEACVTQEDSGWLFAGKEKGTFVAMSVSQVLSTVLGPYSGILRGAMMVFLVCGSVVAHDDSFGQLQQTVLDYNVIVEQLDISKAFPTLLALSSCLGQHTKVILMIREDAHGVHNLLVTQFAHAHTQTQPWGVLVPGQCPLCRSTNSWSTKVAVQAPHESQEPHVQDQAPVSRYLYTCAYPECGKAQRKSSYKFHIDKPPGVLVNAAKTKSSNWFQSPSTTFPPSLMSLPASWHTCSSSEWICGWIAENTLNYREDEPVELPKALKKAIRRYYRQFLTDEDDILAEQELLGDEPDDEKFGLSPEEREAAACPKDVAFYFYKKEVSDWDVAQKLFKQEMDQYDKDEQEKLGGVEDAREKWNREGAPSESQAMYRKRHLKKYMDDFAEQMCHTMGCRVVILASYKKLADQTLSIVVNESKPVNCYEKFAEWSKLEFYLEENEGESDEEDKDEGKDSLPQLILDKHGYAKLPSHTGVSSRGQQELVRQIFHASYKALTDTAKPVPWGEVVGNPTLYLDPDSLPKGFILRDPSHMRTKNVNELWDHWEARKAAKKPLVIFMAAKIGDMSKKRLEHAVPYKGKTTMKYVKIDPDKTSSTTRAASACPTPRTKRPAEADTPEDKLADTAPMPHRVIPAEASSSEDELAAAASTGHAPRPATQPSIAQLGAPAAVPIKDRIQFLKSLSNNNEYLLLVEGIRDLGKEPSLKGQKEWPAWATWSWEGSYLPSDLHSVEDAVNKVRGGVKHLLKAKHIQQESAIIDNGVVGEGSGAVDGMNTTADSEEGGNEEMLRQKLVYELKMKEEQSRRNDELKQQVEAKELQLKEIGEENSHLAKEREENERQVAEEEKEKDEEEEEEMKGKKRTKSSRSRKPSKKYWSYRSGQSHSTGKSHITHILASTGPTGLTSHIVFLTLLALTSPMRLANHNLQVWPVTFYRQVPHHSHTGQYRSYGSHQSHFLRGWPITIYGCVPYYSSTGQYWSYGSGRFHSTGMSHIIYILASTGPMGPADFILRAYPISLAYWPILASTSPTGLADQYIETMGWDLLLGCWPVHALQAWPVTIYGYLPYYLGTGQYWFYVAGQSPYHPKLTVY